jgi:hypothetical protein
MADREKLPQNATEAQGMLIKAFHEKYGDEILPMIERIMGLQGRALGLKAKSKLPDNRLSTVGSAFMKNFAPESIQVPVVTDGRFHMIGSQCPFGLDNTSRKLCEAVMAIDRAYFVAATDGKANMDILKTRAEGEDVCDIVYTVKE